MKRVWNLGCWQILLLVYCGNAAEACTREELVMIQIVSRHGSTSPRATYPEDPNPVSTWKEGLDDLIMLGKFQPYALGCHIRALYEDFITSDPTEVEVTSSAQPKSVKSAQSLLASLYAPSPYWEVVQNFSWQPIHIKYDKEEDDMYLSNPACLAADKELERVMARESTAVFQGYKELIYFWQLNSGWELQSIRDIDMLYDVLFKEASYNLTVPDWAKSSWNELKFCHELASISRSKTKVLQRLRGGPLVGLTVERMKKRIADETDQKKVAVYMTQAENIAAFLSAMGMWNFQQPGPCSTVLIELYKHEGNPFVRYLYVNSTTPEKQPQLIYPLTVPGCTEFCHLDYIIEYTKAMIPTDWKDECRII
ncbi:prostatic acid phosphatase-like [Uloborus diversus]|uniref:prostatic acid phosphatase-like n=1 Tax=Uloborus diversus TaxID=327109 RepID=UPI00240A4239|nr:prostatic acid phosphatase-like [Uloborus diversus]